MSYQRFTGIILGVIFLLVFPTSYLGASPTGYEIGDDFRNYYDRSGGLSIFGYAISSVTQFDGRQAQYFERQRLEIHPEHAGTDYEILLGHLGWLEAEQRGLLGHPAFRPRPAEDSNSEEYFSETGHSISPLFRDYWHSNGLDFGSSGSSFRESLALFGYPISEEFIDPETGLRTQYFERAKFEYHSEFAGTEYEILLGHLGRMAWQIEVDRSTHKPDVVVEFDRTAPLLESKLHLGITHTQHSLDQWGDPGSVKRGRDLLTDLPDLYQNQHIMGWGANNPSPAPGVYDWNSLDRRMNLIHETGGTPVITLCCAPDWMKGGAAGETNWDRLEEAPLPEHFSDFAELSRQVALRYPEVEYFLVWNELKGFYDEEQNRWDAESYTHLYNLVHEAVKSANPNAKIGGPYIVLDSWGDRSRMSHPSHLSGSYGTFDQRPLDVIEYWLENSSGADFIAVDASRRNRDGIELTDPFTGLQKFSDATEWVAQRTELPIWWAEWYVGGGGSDVHAQNALMTAALIEMIKSGVSVPLRWEPQERGDAGPDYHGENVWTDTRVPGGGKPLPFYQSIGMIFYHFAEGTTVYSPIADTPQVAVLASDHYAILVNTLDSPLIVEVDEAVVSLAPYETRLVRTAT